MEVATRLDSRVLLYSLAAGLASVLLFALWPSLRTTRSDLVTPVKGPIPSAPRYRSRHVLIAGQTALCAVLLVTAVLLARAFVSFLGSTPGIRIDNLLVATFDPTAAGLDDAKARILYDDIQRRIRMLPAVHATALASHVPLEMSDPLMIAVGREDALDPDRDLFAVPVNRVTPEYFEVTRTAILEGRPLIDRDTATSPTVALVNQTLAERLWPGGRAVGQRMRVGRTGRRLVQVVGVARDGKYDDVTEPRKPYLYLAFAQDFQFFQSRMSLLIHTVSDPLGLSGPVRSEIQRAAPDVPLYNLRSMRHTYEAGALAAPRLMAQLVSGMAGIGLLLAVAGLHAVVAFVVSRRRREIGIRIALGQSPASVLRSALRSGMKTALVGVALGLGTALLITPYFRFLLGDIDPRDAVVLAGVGLLLAASALAACWFPARRASRVDPVITLRDE